MAQFISTNDGVLINLDRVYYMRVEDDKVSITYADQ